MKKIDDAIKQLKEMKELLKRAPEGVDPKAHERCVTDVKAKGHDVGSAHAICTSSMKKDAAEDLDVQVKQKKEQYANINNKMPDPMKQNLKIAEKEVKIKKDEDGYEANSQYVKHDDGQWHKVLNVKDDGKPHSEGGGNWYHLEGVKEPVHQNKRGPLASGAMLNAGVKKTDLEKSKRPEGVVPEAPKTGSGAQPKNQTKISGPVGSKMRQLMDEGSVNAQAKPHQIRAAQDRAVADQSLRDVSPKHKEAVSDAKKRVAESKRAKANAKYFNKPDAKEEKTVIRRRVAKNDLIEALDKAGHRESALCLKNWDEKDSIAEKMEKAMSDSKLHSMMREKMKERGITEADAGKALYGEKTVALKPPKKEYLN